MTYPATARWPVHSVAIPVNVDLEHKKALEGGDTRPILAFDLTQHCQQPIPKAPPPSCQHRGPQPIDGRWLYLSPDFEGRRIPFIGFPWKRLTPPSQAPASPFYLPVS